VLALAGKRTIVIGADLRKPKLFEELNLRNDKGLSQYLSHMATLEEIIQPTSTENLFLLPGGPMPPNPSELLLRPEMRALIQQLRQQFDYVVLDTPPVGLVTDALTLASLADHVLFVVRQNYTPLTMLKALEEHHLRGSFTKSSIVFNDLRRSGLGYGYGYSSYTYYGYGKSATKGYGSYFGRKTKSNGSGYYEE
jgi:capsular exopolysaccharide synthesis family protein